MAGGTSFTVNYDSLAELSKRLSYIGSTFEAMGAHPAVDRGALGVESLASTLEDFLDGWSQGRKQISQSLSATVETVSSASSTYRQADQEVARATGVDTSPGPGAGAAPSSAS